MTTDQDGNLDVADCFSGRVQKFTRNPMPDRRRSCGQILQYPAGDPIVNYQYRSTWI